jgi:hypothetical protein
MPKITSQVTLLLEVLRNNGKTTADLEDIVHEAAAGQASSINTAGLEAQVTFLLQRGLLNSTILDRLVINSQLTERPYPIYNQCEWKLLPKGLYVGLFHGRNSPEQVMDGWGFDGPVIGPLKWFHTTYGDHQRGEFIEGHHEHASKYLRAGIIDHIDEYLMHTTPAGDMVVCQDKYYGDFTVYYNAEGA